MSDIKQLWQSQEKENDMIALDDIRRRAGKFQSRLHWRNTLLFGVVALGAAGGVYDLSRSIRGFTGNLKFPLPPVVIGAESVLHIVAMTGVAFALWRWGRVKALPAELAGEAALDFHRHELERQRDAAASALYWLVLPFVTIYAVSLTLFVLYWPAQARLLLPPMLGTGVFWTCVWLFFSRSSVRLDLELERLRRLRAE